MVCAAGSLGHAPTTAAEGATTAEGPATEGLAAVEEPATGEEPSAGGVGLWRTCGLKEWAPLVFAIFEPERKQLERRWVFRNGWMK